MASEYDAAVKTVQERVEDAMREVGTLLITFAPLDAALAEGILCDRGRGSIRGVAVAREEKDA